MAGSRPQGRSHRAAVVASFAVAQALVLALLIGPVVTQRWWTGVRDYFAYDQLGYLAIAVNVASGRSPFIEPFTLTGHNYYPSLWFTVIGLLAHVTRVPVYVLWTVLGLAAVLATVALVGWLALRWSRRWYAPAVPALLLLTGVLTPATYGGWATSLHGHAILWGPYGTLFTLNAEVIGLCLTTTAMVLVILAWPSADAPRAPIPRHPTLHFLTAAGIIGILANLHAYSFFTATVLTALYISVRSLLRWQSRQRLLLTFTLMGCLLVAGPWIARRFGPLPLFVLILLSLLPCLWPLIRARPFRTAAATAIFVLMASPQILRTTLALASGDPFLTFRQQAPQTVQLTVPAVAGLLAALPLLMLGTATLLASIRQRAHTVTALVVALGSGWMLMSQNQAWGFGQEPYRFWLQFEVLSALLLGPAITWAWARRRQLKSSQRSFTAVAVIAMAVWALSLITVPIFWRQVTQTPVIALADARAGAIADALAPHTELAVGSACIRPQALKIISPGPIAFYSEGFAWPDRPSRIDSVMKGQTAGHLDLSALQRAAVRYVLTDSLCEHEWISSVTSRLTIDRTVNYAQEGVRGTITRWKVPELPRP